MKIGKHEVEISSPDKILFPESGISKEDLIHYYTKVSRYMLPHVKGRPISMQRFPNGIGQHGFFQKEAADYFPKYVKQVRVKLKAEGSKNYVDVENAATLAYLANLGTIPIHTWLSKKGHLNRPDLLIWDLDPSDNDFEKVREAAMLMHDMLNKAGIEPYLKTTGSRGLHVVLPIHMQYTFGETRKLAKKVADTLVKKNPKLLTTEMSIEKRGDKVFVDYLRNGFAQTAVAPYAVRAKEGAPVAMPLRWEELEDPHLNAQSYNISNALSRLKMTGDLWKKMEEDPLALKEIEKACKAVKSRKSG